MLHSYETRITAAKKVGSVDWQTDVESTLAHPSSLNRRCY